MVLFLGASLKLATAPLALSLQNKTVWFTVSFYQLDFSQALLRHKARHPHGVQDPLLVLEKDSKKHNPQDLFETIL